MMHSDVSGALIWTSEQCMVEFTIFFTSGGSCWLLRLLLSDEFDPTIVLQVAIEQMHHLQVLSCQVRKDFEDKSEKVYKLRK